MNGFVEFLGWFGAVTVLLGYLLFSTGKLPNGPVYQLFNLVGGLSVAINVAAHHAVPSTIVNGIWALVAMVVLVRTGRARRAARRGLPAASARLAPEPVAHVEPPTTTAVLPVIGPALRAHDDATTAMTATIAMTSTTATSAMTSTTPTDGRTVGARATTPAADPTTPARSTAPTTGSIPLVESVPVITAAIALALVHAAQDRTHDDRPDDHENDHDHDYGPGADAMATGAPEHTPTDADHRTSAS